MGKNKEYEIEQFRKINRAEIIEQYPEDHPFPSCLILGKVKDRYIHKSCLIAGKEVV